MFPIWEKDSNGFKLNYVNKNPITVKEFASQIGKFRNLSDQQLQSIQKDVDERYAILTAICK